MSFNLKQDEKILGEAHFHWSVYLLPSIWATAMLGISVSLFSSGGSWAPFLIIGAAPILYKFLQNKMKKYIITNFRFFRQEGVLSRRVVEVPIAKINDVGFKQNLLQLVFRSGTVTVMTGNDAPIVISSITAPALFKEAITAAINHKETHSQNRVQINIA